MKGLNFKYCIVCLVIVLCLIVGGIMFLPKNKTSHQVKKTTPTTQVKNEDVSITISAVGDCTLGTDPKFNYATSLNKMYELKGADYFLKGVRPVFEKDDLTLVNFEGTLTKRTTAANKAFRFKADPEYMKILTNSSVEAVSFANNHAHDFGEGSYTDTIQAFKDYKMTYASYDQVGCYKVKGKTIGMVAVYGPHAQQDIINGVKQLKEAKADIIIVSMHAGIEKDHYPNATQKNLAHLAVDQGANLVLGHHPHVLQGVEKYKGVYIDYSLANFCFGGNKNPSDKDTLILQKTFTFKNNQLVMDDSLKVIPCSISSVSYKNDYQPTILEGNNKQRIIHRLNTYSRNYHVSFDDNGHIKK